jgi:hypothetical protein
MRILSFVSADFDPAIGWCGREFVFGTAGSSDAISMLVDSASPHTLHASRPVSGGWLICDQLADEARDVGVKLSHRRILQPNGLRRDGLPATALTAPYAR